MDRGAWWVTVHGITELDMTEQLTIFSKVLEHVGSWGGIQIQPVSAFNVTSNLHLPQVTTAAGQMSWNQRVWLQSSLTGYHQCGLGIFM